MSGKTATTWWSKRNPAISASGRAKSWSRSLTAEQGSEGHQAEVERRELFGPIRGGDHRGAGALGPQVSGGDPLQVRESDLQHPIAEALAARAIAAMELGMKRLLGLAGGRAGFVDAADHAQDRLLDPL